MIWLVLSIVCSAAVAVLLKFASVKKVELFPLFLVNYLIALFLGISLSRPGALGTEPPVAILIALGMGMSFILGFLVFHKAIETIGTGIAASVSRLSVSGPLLLSILLFKEVVGPLQLGGIVLAISILPLSGKIWPPWKTKPTEDTNTPSRGLFWSLALYGLFAMNDSVLKIRTELLPQSDSGVFFAILFGTAAVLSLGLTIHKKQKLTSQILLIGFPLGLVNYGTAHYLSKALEVMPGFQAFTLNSIGVIFLSIFVSRLLFSERLQKHNYLFLAGSILAIVLLRL